MSKIVLVYHLVQSLSRQGPNGLTHHGNRSLLGLVELSHYLLKGLLRRLQKVLVQDLHLLLLYAILDITKLRPKVNS